MHHKSKSIVILILLIIFLAIGQSVYAQTISLSPDVWQTSANGLELTNVSFFNGYKQFITRPVTAGLGFYISNQNGPFLMSAGGVADAGFHQMYPMGIDLGLIKPAGAQNVPLQNQETDWAHNTLTYAPDSGESLSVTVSRLSPAVVVNTNASSLSLFTGNVRSNQIDIISNTPSVTATIEQPSFPKYVAYPTSSGTQIQQISDITPGSITLSENWILVWYGQNSYFNDSKIPLEYEPETSYGAYQADIPVLLYFQNIPGSIVRNTGGGITVNFTGSAENIALLPLYGREILKAGDTETWIVGLPPEVQQKIQWWSRYICQYPKTVSETYSYNEVTDTSNITDTITFESICTNQNGTSFAPVAPFVSLVKDLLPIQFSDTLGNPEYLTEFGPYLGIEKTNTYTWQLSGMKPYVDMKRIFQSGSVPSSLQTELQNQIDSLVSSGHMAPWLFLDEIPRHPDRGYLYFSNPGEVFSLLAGVFPVLSQSQQNALVSYLQQEQSHYPVADIPYYPLFQGTARLYFTGENSNFSQSQINQSWNSVRKTLLPQNVELYSFYGLSDYYALVSSEIPTFEELDSVLQEANRELSERDWATFNMFSGPNDIQRYTSVAKANRLFAGLLGVMRLTSSNSTVQNTAMPVLAKTAVMRTALARYPRYLYENQLIELPKNIQGIIDPQWQPKMLNNNEMGILYNYSWAGPYDDPRQVDLMDQFGTILRDTSGYLIYIPNAQTPGWSNDGGQLGAHIPAYKSMPPELMRFLEKNVKQDVEIYYQKYEALFPQWYSIFSEGMLGWEHNLSHPLDSYQIFMAKALLQKDTPENLELYTDVPWLETGDLFYISKLAETIKAYRGWCWSDDPACLATITPSPLPSTPGDTDHDGDVDIFDYNAVITDFGKTGTQGFSVADFDDDGDVDIFDYNVVISNFGR